MKKIIFILLLIAFIIGCDTNNPKSVNLEDLDISFFITDENGQQTSEITGEEFRVVFEIVNNADQSLGFSYTGTPVVFKIYKDGKLISTSTDYVVFPQVEINAKLYPKMSINYNWLAPNTLGRELEPDKVTLEKGKYTVTVFHDCLFDEIKIPQIDEITFEVK